jgi:Mg-chelatase subunit ChlD
LRTRALVQGEAQKERGIQTPTEAFRRVQRKHTDDPNLTIGVMVDISGSMRSAMNPMASAAWILSEATRRVQGKVAMTYYGSGVFSTLKAGQHLDRVNVYSASDATEKFDKAFQALDGSLNLLNGSGARLLVIVSDGAYTHDEQRKAHEWVKRCGQSGVAVLWLGAGSYGSSGERYTNGVASAVHVELGENVTDAADEIGRSAERALTTAGSRR